MTLATMPRSRKLYKRLACIVIILSLWYYLTGYIKHGSQSPSSFNLSTITSDTNYRNSSSKYVHKRMFRVDGCEKKRFSGIKKQLRGIPLVSSRAGHGVSQSDCGQKMTLLSPHGSVTALASFPGSGNTWTRHLLQQISGIYSGSVYDDSLLLENGFPAEGVRDGSVVVVKTHYPYLSAYTSFQKVILLIRNPYECIVSMMKFISAGHVGQIGDAVFKTKEWRKYAFCVLQYWKMFHEHWLSFKGPLFLLRYEDLQTNMVQQMTKVMTFLNLKVSEKGIECLQKNSEGNFHRTTRNSSSYTSSYYSTLFRNEMNRTITYIDNMIIKLEKQVNITEYLR